ncbi:MAG: hypothetical protein HZA53_19310 [Planctomycetes bacterium]|nr:hypothetical protein [Planctomycetota bacterium]
MSEAQWSPDAADQPVKKSIPKWVWFCGGGCLLAILAGIVVLALSVNYFKNAIDPAVSEPALQKVLPHDELPPSMTIQFYNSIGIEQFQIVDTRGFQLQIQVHKGADGGRAREQMFQKETPEFPKDLGVMKFEDMEKSAVDIQGRELPVIRMRMEFTGVMGKVMPEEAKSQMGSMLWTDLTPEGATNQLVLAQLMRMKGSGEITDDELRDLLAPFHIGPKR